MESEKKYFFPHTHNKNLECHKQTHLSLYKVKFRDKGRGTKRFSQGFSTLLS